MDIAATTAPRSDQLNYDDVASVSLIVTVADVKRGTAEQPVEVHLHEYPGRPYKPSKSMRRVLVAAWTADSAVYIGRRLELYGDPEVTFGRDKVGGIKIRSLSHIDKSLSVALTVTRGKRAPYVIQPLREAPQRTREERITDALGAIAAAADISALDKTWARIIKGGLNDAPELVKARDQRLTQLGGVA